MNLHFRATTIIQIRFNSITNNKQWWSTYRNIHLHQMRFGFHRRHHHNKACCCTFILEFLESTVNKEILWANELVKQIKIQNGEQRAQTTIIGIHISFWNKLLSFVIIINLIVVVSIIFYDFFLHCLFSLAAFSNPNKWL